METNQQEETPKKVLLVEDDFLVLKYIEREVTRAKNTETDQPLYKVEIARDAASAKKLIKQHDYYAIVTDLVMEHDLAGIDVLNALLWKHKENNTENKTKVIIITAYAKKLENPWTDFSKQAKIIEKSEAEFIPILLEELKKTQTT